MKHTLFLALILGAVNVSFAQDQVSDPMKGFSLAVRGGWSYRTAKAHPDLSKELREHYKGLRSGYHVGGDAVYYLSEYIGIGLKYTMSRFEQTSYGTIQDNITLNYIGPSVYGRYLFAQQKLQFIYGVSLGYLHYKDKGYFEQPLTLTGQTFSGVLDLGLHLKVSDHFLIGLEPSLSSGILNKVEISNGPQTETIEFEDEERENLSQVNVALKLTWNF